MARLQRQSDDVENHHPLREDKDSVALAQQPCCQVKERAELGGSAERDPRQLRIIRWREEHQIAMKRGRLFQTLFDQTVNVHVRHAAQVLLDVLQRHARVYSSSTVAQADLSGGSRADTSRSCGSLCCRSAILRFIQPSKRTNKKRVVGDLAQVHIQRNKVIEAILFLRVAGAAELRVVLGDVALVQLLLRRKHVNALCDVCLWWEFGKNVFLHAAKNEGLQNLSCVLENRLGLFGGCDLFRCLLQFVGARGVEEGEEGEEFGKVVLNGSACEEELVGRSDLAESL